MLMVQLLWGQSSQWPSTRQSRGKKEEGNWSGLTIIKRYGFYNDAIVGGEEIYIYIERERIKQSEIKENSRADRTWD